MKFPRTMLSLLLMGLFLVSYHCDAQVISCTDRYETAMSLYNYGLADSALSTLKPCLESKQALKQVSNETAGEMFRLAALSSILTGNPQEAERYVTQLLKYHPDYNDNLREDDLEEFRLMLSSKTARPELVAGIRAGINMPLLTLQDHFTDPAKTAAQFNLGGTVGYAFALTVEKAFSRSISVVAGGGITRVNFNYEVSSTDARYEYAQDITYLEIPVLARYNINLNGPVRPYIQAGLSGKFSMYLREKSDDYGKYWLTESANEGYILATFLTGMENMGLVGGAGISLNLGKFTVMADFRYAHHLNSSGKLSKFDDISGYEDIPTEEEFGYTNDLTLITLKDLQISLGLCYNLRYKVF